MQFNKKYVQNLQTLIDDSFEKQLEHFDDEELGFFASYGYMIDYIFKSDQEWEDSLNSFHAKAYRYVYDQGGLLSGEHGIGAKKIRQLAAYSDPGQMLMMTTIKKALDPLDVLNPGKVIARY